MKKLAVLIGMLVVFTCGTSAWASLTMYNSGSMSNYYGNTVPGMTAAGGDSWTGIKSGKGVKLNWEVLHDTVSGLWEYNYVFTTNVSNNKFLESFYLSVGTGYSLSSLNSYSLTAYATHDATGTGSTISLLGLNNYSENYGYISSSSQKSIYGLGWDIPVPTSGGYFSFKLTMDTYNSPPMWGDFIAQGDPATGDADPNKWTYNTAWNSQFGNTITNLTTDSVVGKVLTPSAVPIPPAFFLFGSGLSGLFFLKRRRFTA